jgi:phosphate transport system substrate-binding protein
MVFVAVGLLLAACDSNSGYVKIKGSETVLPIALELAEQVSADPRMPLVSVTAGGSGVGIAALVEGNTDLAMSSRDIKLEEKIRIRSRGEDFTEIVIGFDALALIVHPSNPVDSLSLQQIKGIFQGTITNWKEVGGRDLPIVPFNRESSSGTYEFFKKVVLSKERFGKLQTVGANGELAEKVASSPNSIGYVGIAFVDERMVKAVRIYNPATGRSVAATIKNSMNGSYPLARPLYFYYLNRDEARVKPIIDLITSERGQRMVLKTGYPPNPKYLPSL